MKATIIIVPITAFTPSPSFALAWDVVKLAVEEGLEKLVLLVRLVLLVELV